MTSRAFKKATAIRNLTDAQLATARDTVVEDSKFDLGSKHERQLRESLHMIDAELRVRETLRTKGTVSILRAGRSS